MEPLISILIPTYNRPNELLKAIKSVLSQTYKNIEIIITDNSNNTDSKDIVESNFFLHPNIFYYKNNENIGPVFNWKKALLNSKGEYCIILPDDDFLINCFYLEDAIRIIYENKVDLLITSCVFGYNTENIICSSSQKKYISGNEFLKGFWKHYHISTIANVFSKKFAIELDAFNNSNFLYADIEFWLKLASRSDICYYNIPSVYYTFHDNNIVLNMNKDALVTNSGIFYEIINVWSLSNKFTNEELNKIYLKLLFRYNIFVCNIYKINLITFSKKVLNSTNVSFFSFMKVNFIDIIKYIFINIFISIKNKIRNK